MVAELNGQQQFEFWARRCDYLLNEAAHSHRYGNHDDEAIFVAGARTALGQVDYWRCLLIGAK